MHISSETFEFCFMNSFVLYVCMIACLIYRTYMLSLNYNVHDYEYVNNKKWYPSMYDVVS